MPGLNEISVQLSPPSVVFHSPLRPPPWFMLQGVRWNFHIDANRMRGVGGVDRQVHRAGGIVEKQDLLPRAPTVGGAEHAALRVRPERVAHGRDVGAVGVAGVDDDVADLLGVAEPEVLPARAAVGGAVDAGAVGEVLAQLASPVPT
jgi:hypothetical protein